MSDFYQGADGIEIHYNDLICKCGKKADQMYDEADTLLVCECGEVYYHII